MVSKCKNTGDIVGNNPVGGILGYAENAKVSFSTNEGYIMGSTSIGGILGSSKNCLISNCKNAGTIKATLGYAGSLGGFDNGESATANFQNTGEIISKTPADKINISNLLDIGKVKIMSNEHFGVIDKKD